MSSYTKLAIACGGIFLSFSYFAVLQEDVYKKTYGKNNEKFEYTFLALIAERGINSLIALLGMLVLGGSGVKIPHKDIFNSGVTQMLAMAASNEALRFVSYPTQVLGKSCKMLPVMAGGILLGGKRYQVVQYVQVALITLGVALFNFGGKKKGAGNDSAFGLLLIGAALVLDAVTGGLQDKVKLVSKELNPGAENPKPTMHESMFYTNLSGCIVAVGLGAATGQLLPGLVFCQRNPEVLRAILIYSLASGVGQNFIYYTITEFNPLLLTTVTTTRKIFSTLYSVVRSGVALDLLQTAGCGLAIFGLLIDVFRGKQHEAPPKKDAAQSAKKQ
jgi:UDP-galactose transporter B1